MITAEQPAVNRLSSSHDTTCTNTILQDIKCLGWQPKKKKNRGIQFWKHWQKHKQKPGMLSLVANRKIADSKKEG